MPPNQLAHVRSCTPAVLRMPVAWLVGIEKISDVERMVTMRVDELPSVAALKPSSTARSAANRNTASATLMIVSTVRRLLRRALLRMREKNFIPVVTWVDRSAPGSANDDRDSCGDERALLEVIHVAGS